MYLLDLVLRVWFPSTALHLCRVQETVFPYGIGSITGQSLNHLQWNQWDDSVKVHHHECRKLLLFFPTSSRESSALSLTWSSVGGHPLCLRCFTMEIWRPRLRWTEQHSSQIRTPRLMLAQPGSVRHTKRRTAQSQVVCDRPPGLVRQLLGAKFKLMSSTSSGIWIYFQDFLELHKSWCSNMSTQNVECKEIVI